MVFAIDPTESLWREEGVGDVGGLEVGAVEVV